MRKRSACGELEAQRPRVRSVIERASRNPTFSCHRRVTANPAFGTDYERTRAVAAEIKRRRLLWDVVNLPRSARYRRRRGPDPSRSPTSAPTLL